MAILQETVTELNGVKLHVIQTDKYKTNTLVWKMKAPITKETITYRALLPYVLQSSSKKFPTTGKLRAYLDDLYGASFYVDLAKKGEYHIITFTVEIANEKFLSDQTPLLQKGVEFLAEILKNPNVSEDAFDEETVNKEKRSLKQRIQAIHDDKMKYASLRLIEEMCKSENYSLPTFGVMDEIDQVTPKELFSYYNKAFAEDELDFYVVGDVEKEEVEEYVKNLLSFPKREPFVVHQSDRKEIEEKTIVEKEELNQGKLNIGYRTNTLYGDEDYFALQVFNGIYGGFAHSKLFMNVREKESLAYYAASRLESHKGLLLVMSGIDHKNFVKAVTIIKEQMDEMKKGNFSDEELTQTKAVIKNQLLETIDTPRGSIEVLYHNVVTKNHVTLDDWIKKIEQTTRDEIVKVASKIQLDTIYFLTGSEGNE